jgi:hypothetical protein
MQSLRARAWLLGISILASASAVLHHRGIVPPIGTGRIDRIEGGGATMVVLIALIILFGAATYFTDRWLDAKAGLTTVIILIALWALSGFGFG